MSDPVSPDEKAVDPAADEQAAGGGTVGNATADDSAAGGEKEHLNADDIEKLLNQASESLEQATATAPATPPEPFQLDELAADVEAAEGQPIDLLGEVELDLRIELGRTQMRLEEVLQLRQGSVVALDKLAGDPVDIFANGRLIARGEVLVMNDNFCVRVTELVGS